MGLGELALYPLSNLVVRVRDKGSPSSSFCHLWQMKELIPVPHQDLHTLPGNTVELTPLIGHN